MASHLAVKTSYRLLDYARREIAGLAQLSDCGIGGGGFNQAARLLSPSIKSNIVKTWHGGI